MAGSDFVIVILAAGKGTRLKSNLAKVLHRAGGRSLVEHVARACRPLGAKAMLAVVGHQAEDVAAVVEPLGAQVVLQQPQRGTGHALLVARGAIGQRAKYALVVPGDAPLVRTETLRTLVRAHQIGNAAATILTAQLTDPIGYGRIVRKQDGSVAAIVEQSALLDDQRDINEINSSIYCFTLEKLWPCLGKLRPENVHKELYLTDAIALLNQQGETVLAEVTPDPQEILGANARADLAEVDRIFRQRKRAALMDAGVTIQLPETVLIDPEVEVGADTVLEPFVQLLGKTRVGSGCTIRTGSVLNDTVVEENVTVKPYSIVSASHLGKGAQVGPFAHLRDGAQLRPGARVGNFVEVKKSVLGEGAKAMHLTYVGDAKIGSKTNIGAGTITCNYDGVRKNPTTIGKDVFVGSNTALIAPIRVGDRAYIAAGSTVTENIPVDALAIARGRQVNKPGWAAERRREIAAQARKASKPRPRSKTRAKPRPRQSSRRKPAPRRRPAVARRRLKLSRRR
ncbi:MAG: bifunctional UDP-N-acetylglucosamine diphosphorylase/glucosamine-1-phosphate N-acetyltransferase GlmU [Acidobacteria bacterium]|nr:bifunctional UDP-N-acetylglucosamine diphosphorylase/glucosamine-1-phosphate N-acetyltransferase GlmU [Acidobacteriota bacterium]